MPSGAACSVTCANTRGATRRRATFWIRSRRRVASQWGGRSRRFWIVIAQRHPQFAGIAEQLDAPALNRKIVVYHHQRVLEILVIQVDLPDGCGCRVGSAGARNSVPFAPCPQRAYVDES